MDQRPCLAKLGGTLNTISRFTGQAAHRQNTPGKGASMLARICTGCGLLLALVAAALAQSYPAKPLTMIIPFAAGGAHAQAQSLYKTPLYNSINDFTPVALIAEVPIVLIARKDLPVNNLAEFIAYAKTNQSKMQYGSAGAGSATHLGCVLLNYLIGVEITHVPYRGTGPAMQDLQGGRIDYLCEIISTAKPQIDGGTVKGIAIMTKERSKALPDVPTALEQGLPNLEAYTWNAIFLPKGAAPGIVNKLHDATVEAMKTPKVRDSLEGLGAVIVPDERASSEYLAQFLKSEIEKWAGPIKASGVTVE